MKMRRMFSLLLALVLVLGLTATTALADEAVFPDVQPDHWAYEEIKQAYNAGVIDGKPDGTFAPMDSVSRAEFAKMMVLTFNAMEENPEEAFFSDVPTTHWAFGYVEVAKKFLTGYKSPFDGSMSYHPEEAARREDVAAALVQMMGFKEKDAKDPDYAMIKFTDGEDISPRLRAYVSIAAERGLINGYSDGSFGPQKGIARAETVAMLNRAAKTTVTSGSAELELETDVTTSNNGKNVSVQIWTEKGATVTVQVGKATEVKTVKTRDVDDYDDYDHEGMITGTWNYEFEDEGSVDVTVYADQPGKSTKKTLPLKYTVGAPEFSGITCPTSTSKKSATISGNVKDAKYGLSLTINGERVSVSSSGSWSYTANNLDVGKNTFTILAVNDAGKESKVVKNITFNPSSPTITFSDLPDTSSTSRTTISGRVTDENYGFTLTINGDSVSTGSNGTWRHTVELTNGENEITLVATNDAGKTTRSVQTITFNPGGPKLTVNTVPSKVSTTELTLSGTAKDENFDVTVTVADKDGIALGGTVNVDRNGNWEKRVPLREGANEFTITVSNTASQSVSKTVNVELVYSKPEFTFYNEFGASNYDTITIKGKIADEYGIVSFTVNGREKSINYDGTFSFDVNLDGGTNTFEFRAVNEKNQDTKETKTITYGIIENAGNEVPSEE